ncbi:unnamed protein product [Schistosoma spindalis]|nr:unnamed protein product [Schistosoma spindale]
MIFQQDFNTPHIFSPIPIATPQPFSPKATTILSREERMRLRKQERRRRKLQEIKSGVKRFIAMLFSHIGLSGLVIAYTIVGGLLFGGIERGKEKEVKTLAYEYRIDASNEFLQLMFGELHSYIAKQRQSYNDTIAFLEFVIDFLEKEKPNKKTYSVENITDSLDYRDMNHENNTKILNTTNSVNSTFNNFENINLNDSMQTNYFNNLSKLNPSKNFVGLYSKNVTNTVSESELDNIRGEYSLKSQFVLLLRGRVQIALMEFTKRVVDFIETDGWNGNDSMEDLKWSFAGSVLYAITVITTIGYGHATPKTNLGKFMTIIYALIGIPLMFLYLSNIGDYLADIFRVIYSRTCRTSCERFCSATIFNSYNNTNKHIEQMNKFINNNIQQNEPIDNDPTVNPTHSHGRRRKRILLPPFNTKINDYNTSMNNNNNNNCNYTNIKVNCTNNNIKNDSVNLNEIDNKINVTIETTTSRSSFNNKKIKLFHYLKNKQFFIKFLTYSQKSCAFIKKSFMLPFYRSNNTTTLTQKAKNNLRELFHPPFIWLQKMMRTIICENEFKSSPVTMNDNTDNKYINCPNIFFQNIHQGSEFDLLHNIPISTINSNTINHFSNPNTTLNNQMDILSCRTTALIESNDLNDIHSSINYYDSKQLYEQLTKKKILSNQTMKYKHYSTLPLVTSTYNNNNNNLSNTFNSSGYIFTTPKCISTVETLPIFNQSKLYNLQNDSTKYFTYDGQHRKFYLMARYLRSAQRQRRHKRRVQKRLQEQERSEKKRLENEKLYGTLFNHQSNQIVDDRRQNIHNVKSLTDIFDDKASTGSTILSGSGMEEYNDGRIRLLCWKDIDIDLEVRSIDENYDDIHGLNNIENTKQWSTKTTVDGATVIVNMNVSEPISHTNKKRSTKSPMNKVKCNQNRYKSHNSKSYINLEQSTQNDQSLMHTMTEPKNATLKYCTMLNSNTVLSSYPQSPFDVASSSSKPFHKLLTHSISTSDRERLYDVEPLSNSIRPNPAAIHMSYHQIPMNKLTVSKSGLSSLPIHNSLQQKQTSQIPTTSASKTNIPPKLNQNLSFFPTLTLPNSFHYSQPNQCSTMSFLPESHSLQPDSFQRLLQSTVISNPFATCEDVSRDIKPEQLGRSRLSLASSRGDLDSEIVVQLSYYSQRGSKQSEDLSFFSYRDGFSAEEDVSKVTVPISLSLVIMTTYILIGAIVFSIWQDPDYLKWSYFCFITLSTIGFGDIVPGTKIDSTNPKEKMIIICLYVAIGLSVFAMCFKLMQEEVVDKMKWFALRVGILKRKETTDTTDRSLYPMSRI